MEEALYAEISRILNDPDILDKAEAINIPKSDEYVYNSNEQKIHVRSYWPNKGEDAPERINPKGAIFCLHGYGGQSSRLVYKHLAKFYTDNNFVFITMDFHGHGHSEGVGAYIETYVDLVDDVTSVIQAFYTGPIHTNYYKINGSLRVGKSGLPFFILGHSMGGSVAVLTANYLTSRLDESYRITNIDKVIRTQFKGACLICPGVTVSRPPYMVECILTYLVAPIFPATPIPAILGSAPMSPETIWKHQAYRTYAALDLYPENPSGLCYGGSIRFRTAISLLECFDKVRGSAKTITYPFYVLHDPEDQITFCQGAEELFRQAATPHFNKCFETIEGGKHDMLANRLDYMATKTLEWFEEIMQRTKDQADNHNHNYKHDNDEGGANQGDDVTEGEPLLEESMLR